MKLLAKPYCFFSPINPIPLAFCHRVTPGWLQLSSIQPQPSLLLTNNKAKLSNN